MIVIILSKGSVLFVSYLLFNWKQGSSFLYVPTFVFTSIKLQFYSTFTTLVGIEMSWFLCRFYRCQINLTHPEAVLKVPLSLWWFPFSVNVYGSFIENGMYVAEPFKIISVLSLILSLVIPTNNVCFVLFKISIVFGVNVTDCIKGMKSNSMLSFQKLLLWYAVAYILV